MPASVDDGMVVLVVDGGSVVVGVATFAALVPATLAACTRFDAVVLAVTEDVDDGVALVAASLSLLPLPMLDRIAPLVEVLGIRLPVARMTTTRLGVKRRTMPPSRIISSRSSTNTMTH